VVLDSSLTFDQHVRDTVRNCNFHLRALRHIRPSLTSDVANTIACSITGFRLDYFNLLLVGISEQNWDSIQRLQSKAARIVCNASRDSPSSDLLHSLHWLPVRHRIEFKTATVCFKAVQEAQLSQRGRAMLRVIEYFAKSLKVSEGHSK